MPALEAAVLDVIERHEILRTVFPDSDSGPHQVIQDAFTSLEYGTADTREPKELAREFASRGFDITTQAPVRALLLESTPQHHTLVIVIHHIAADGWSIAPLMKDVLTAYVAKFGTRSRVHRARGALRGLRDLAAGSAGRGERIRERARGTGVVLAGDVAGRT
ncbi:condensation domain-containing protein [Rhodococcus sp. 3Y1]